MLGKWTRILVLVMAFALIGTATAINRKIDAMYYGEPPVTYLLPRPELFKYMSLGYDKAVSSVLFVNLIGSLTWKPEPAAYSDWVYNTVNIIISLDPKLFGAYQAGAYFLRDQGPKGEDRAIELMTKASTISDAFEAPLMVAMVYFGDKHDRENAAKWFAIASKRQKAPDYAARIAAGIMNDSDPQAAMEVLLASSCATPYAARKERLTYEFLAYFEKNTSLSDAERGQLVNQFLTRLNDPKCTTSHEQGFEWVDEKLKAEIQRVIHKGMIKQ